MQEEQPPAGWYTDPHAPKLLRYWDGLGWTQHTSPVVPNNQQDLHVSVKSPRRKRIWIMLLVAPIPTLIITLVLQTVVRFAFADVGAVKSVFNVVSILLGLASVVALLLFPLWIILLVIDSKKQ